MKVQNVLAKLFFFSTASCLQIWPRAGEKNQTMHQDQKNTDKNHQIFYPEQVDNGLLSAIISSARRGGPKSEVAGTFFHETHRGNHISTNLDLGTYFDYPEFEISTTTAHWEVRMHIPNLFFSKIVDEKNVFLA